MSGAPASIPQNAEIYPSGDAAAVRLHAVGADADSAEAVHVKALSARLDELAQGGAQPQSDVWRVFYQQDARR